LRTLGRLPDDRELIVSRRPLTEHSTLAEGLREVLWALVNTKEFILNH